MDLFCTDGVRIKSLPQKPDTAKQLPSLSLLGVLGFVKSMIKITLGFGACEAAGFSLESLKSFTAIFLTSNRQAVSAMSIAKMRSTYPRAALLSSVRLAITQTRAHR